MVGVELGQEAGGADGIEVSGTQCGAPAANPGRRAMSHRLTAYRTTADQSVSLAK